MYGEPSPRPWRVNDKPNGQLILYASIVECSDGRRVAFVCRSSDAALICDAVNERDRLRDVVRRTVETLEQVYKHADMTDALREVVAETQREVLAAIGEGEPPTEEGVR